MLAVALAAAMVSSEALVTVLNTSNSVSSARYAEALAVVERDAAEGRPLQQFVLGVTTDDKEKSERLLSASRKTIEVLAEKRDNPLAWYLLSMENNDRKLLERAAKGGNVQALNALGSILIQEAGEAQGAATNEVPRLLREGFECFRKASDQRDQSSDRRDPNALFNIGICYMRGIGCHRNSMLAFECFRSAARGGHPEAMQCLAVCYDRGIGVDGNPDQALFWKMKASACRGDAAAAKWLEGRK